MTVAFRHARPPRGPKIRVYASDDHPDLARLSFHLADLRCIPASSRAKCFAHDERGWIPDRTITQQVLLAEPSEPVDLLTLRAADPNRPLADQLTGEALDHLRPGGQLLVVQPPSDDESLTSLDGLVALDGQGRVFRKEGPIRLFDPLVLEESDENESDTLAARQMQAQLVESHLRLARSLARRFAHHGEPTEDLEQVAMLALVKAARRFDTSRDTAFATYATASVLGELKRHFRDKTWMMRVPRSIQELYLQVKEAREELGRTLCASPTVAQIATHLRVSEEDVLEAMEAGANYWPASLDAGSGDDEQVTDVPEIDGSFDRSLDRQQLELVLPRLDHREQVILKRLYFDGWTQRRVAEEIGVSQMQVSRLLGRTISRLRGWLDEE